ncbi:MAG: hypothetical protein MHMPM18_003492, partial [Marteilia pararefringens]
MVANSSRISGGSSSNDNNNNNQNIQTPKSTNNSESVDSRKTVDVFVCTKCEIYLSSSEHFAYSIEFLHALGFRDVESENIVASPLIYSSIEHDRGCKFRR